MIIIVKHGTVILIAGLGAVEEIQNLKVQPPMQ